MPVLSSWHELLASRQLEGHLPHHPDRLASVVQCENKQRTSRHVVCIIGPEERHFLALRIISIYETPPATPTSNFGDSKFYNLVIRVHDQKQRRVRRCTFNPGDLSATVKQHAKASHIAVVPIILLHLESGSID